MFDQLKTIMQNGERYIVVENGRPEYVFMNFADYVTLTAVGRKGESLNYSRGRGGVSLPGEITRANAELEEIGAEDHSFKTGLAEAPATIAPDPATIRLEDLPL